MQDDLFFKDLMTPHGGRYLLTARGASRTRRVAERLTGYAAEEVLGRCCAEGLLQHTDPNGKLLCNDGCPMEAAKYHGRERAAEVFLHHRKGHRMPITVGNSDPWSRRRIVGAVEVLNGISGQVLAAERIPSSRPSL